MATGAAAQAQTIGTGTLVDIARQSVAVRGRPDFDALGIGAGAFRIYPNVQAQANYDSNVFNGDEGKASDAYARVSPRVVVRSKWSRHQLSLRGGAQIERYQDLKTESNDQFDFGADALLSFRNSTLDLDTSFARRVEQRGTLGDIFTVGDRIRYNFASARGTFSVVFNRLQLTTGANASDINYLPVRVGSTIISQDYRDRRELTGTLRADYQLGPAFRLFASGAYTNQNYDESIAGFNQDAQGYQVIGGVAFGVTDLIGGDIGIGYLRQSYDDSRLDGAGGFAYNGRLVWNPTPLLTVTAIGARAIQQSPFANQSGILQDNLQLTVDYELLRNLILSADAAAVSNRYRSSDRRDRLYQTNLRARYLINRALEAGLTLNYRRQTTEGAGGRRYSGGSVAVSMMLKR